MRTTHEVIESHLRCRRGGDLEADLEQNYHDDVVLLSCGEGVNGGHDGVRRLADVLRTYVNADAHQYDEVLVEKEYAMLRWRAVGSDVQIHDGTDSFVVRDGRIAAQTIAYAVNDR